jgi:two-component system, NtrC family, sensor kinase
MVLLEISIQSRVVIGISAMVVLFTSFLIVFITNQRKKIQYHKDLQAMHEQQQQMLLEQNTLLEKRVLERTAELSEQKETLEETLEELKTSQLQLIQKEKMASLGELSAGIAHEIQNPLNFVLNFGELSKELTMELQERITHDSLPESFTTEMKPLVNDLTENLGKIIHHGKRADGIVKNMLQHTRKHSGVLELTDLNEMIDEYLNLSYHGFRNKNKSFTCTFQNSFGGHVERIRIIPQDIGHTLVNLFNNAFYSMNEKMKHNKEFEPVLSVSTEKKNNKAIICIRDNGTGIQDKILNKIFQPFFTTKPTGEATGLGLSLGYDFIKAHQGEIKAESNEGEYAVFTIELPYL